MAFQMVQFEACEIQRWCAHKYCVIIHIIIIHIVTKVVEHSSWNKFLDTLHQLEVQIQGVCFIKIRLHSSTSVFSSLNTGRYYDCMQCPAFDWPRSFYAVQLSYCVGAAPLFQSKATTSLNREHWWNTVITSTPSLSQQHDAAPVSNIFLPSAHSYSTFHFLLGHTK